MTTYTNANGVTYNYTPPVGAGTGSLVVSAPGLDTTTYTIGGVSGNTVQTTDGGSQSVLSSSKTTNYFDVPTVGYTYNFATALKTSTIIHVGGTATLNDSIGGLFRLTVEVEGGAATYNAVSGGGSPLTVDLESHGRFLAGTSTLSDLSGASINYAINGGVFVTGSDSSFANITLDSGLSLDGFVTASDYVDDGAISFSGIQSYTITSDGSDELITFNEGADGTGDAAGSVDVQGTALATGSFNLSATSQPLTVANDGAGGTLFDPTACFLRGACILAAKGEVLVEELQAGDLVCTRQVDGIGFQPVIWVGRRDVDARGAGGGCDAFPVRISRGAFGRDIPKRDLLVTSDHCIFVDGRLVPVRMLVNGGTIAVDSSIDSYEYFHIELEDHAIIFSEGLAVESYLDTGNRGNFANSLVAALRPDLAVNAAHKSWQDHAAAPLAVDAATVEPIWRRLADRSASLRAPAPAAATTEEPDLTLRVDGRLVRPICDDARIVFALPRDATEVTLVSRSSRPAASRPWLDDRRRLGVNVSRIVLRGSEERVDIPLDGMSLSSGWWDVEGEGASMRRWTDGAAVVTLPAMDDAPSFLELRLDGGMIYLAGAAEALAAA